MRLATLHSLAPSRAIQFPCRPACTKQTHTKPRTGSARPGAKHQRCFAECVAEPVPAADVAGFVAFMQQRGVGAVVSLLSRDEVDQTYAAPGVEAAMRAAFGDGNYSNVQLKGGEGECVRGESFCQSAAS